MTELVEQAKSEPVVHENVDGVSSKNGQKRELEDADSPDPKKMKAEQEVSNKLKQNGTNSDETKSTDTKEITVAAKEETKEDKKVEEDKNELPKSYNIAYKEDGTVDTSRMIPAPPPDIRYETNLKDAMPNHQKQYLLRSLKSIKRLKDATPFLAPVDIVALNIPFYFNFVPKPMDLSTIETRLNSDSYRQPEDVHADFNLMIQNCVTFNGEKAPIARMGSNIQASFEKLLLNVPSRDPSNGSSESGRHKRKQSASIDGNGVPTIRRDTSSGRPKREIHPPKPKDMPYDIRPRNKKLLADLRFAGQVLKELTSKKHESYNYPFLLPVDPVALDCPTYFDVVKHPMDLSTIQNKLSNNQYDHLDDFHHDVKLVFQNCYSFNPEGSPVNLMGHRLEEVFDKKWLDKPVHAPSPPAGGRDDEDEYEYYDDDEFDEDEERAIENSIANTQAIQYLEQQIERMKEDLEKMKRAEYEKAKKSALKSRRKRKKIKKVGSKVRKAGREDVDDEPIELTFDMKKELSEQIADLNEKKLQHVMKIINESVPDLQKDGEDEIELDMDMLDDETLLKLYNYVVAKNSSIKKKSKLNGNGKAGKRKSGIKRASDRDKQINMLKQRIEEYDKGSYGVNNSSDEDDDDDDESESSEEE